MLQSDDIQQVLDLIKQNVQFHKHLGIDSPQLDYNNSLINKPSGGGGSKVRVHMSTNTTANGDQQIPFDTIDIDTNNEWDVTAKQFTAKTAGYYFCYFQAYYAGLNTNFQYAWRIYKNSLTVIAETNKICVNSSDNPITSNVAVFVQLAAGDKIDFHAYNQSGGAITIDKGSSLTSGSIIQIA